MLPLADYRAARLAALTAPDGWLNLVARIDLAPGRHRVGAAQEVQLPAGPDLLGTLDLTATGASFARPGEAPQPFRPVPDAFPQLRIDPFLLEIHTVDGIPALRVRDLTQHSTVDLRYFPDDPAWTIRAISARTALARSPCPASTSRRRVPLAVRLRGARRARGRRSERRRGGHRRRRRRPRPRRAGELRAPGPGDPTVDPSARLRAGPRPGAPHR